MGGQRDRGKRTTRAGLGHAARSRAARVGVKAEGDAAVRYCSGLINKPASADRSEQILY